MVACQQCGTENPDGFRFCGRCGAVLEAAAAPREVRKTVTVVFCDLTGSTALGESVDPEALRGLLARYFERMQSIVESHGGTVEKFIGDAVMAVFGVPQLHEDDALRACRAAQEMRDALPALGLQARIGVNTGEVVAGTAERLATGDAVNVAARLEQAAQPGEVLVGAETLRLVRPAVEIGERRLLELKGKAEAVAGWPLVAVTGELERRLSTRMVGRERELTRLRSAFDQAVHDRSCQLFTVLGSAGVGKSRLAGEFLGSVEASVVRGRCLSYGEGITYWPVVEILKQLDALPEGDAARPLRALLSETEEPATAEEVAWAFRKLLEQEAQVRPVVCVLDDLHWAEETLLDLVEHIADLSRDAPLLLLCMARPELLERRPSWAGGKWNATTVLLEPLDAGETELLLRELGGVADALRERIVQVAEGNPFFLEEVLALVRDSHGGQVEVPPTIQALLAARLDQLDPADRSVLERGSVEGRTFHRGAVAALADGDGSLDQRLVSLVRKELVRPDRAQLPGDDAYRFRHLLIRDAAYDALPKAMRADLHERFATWLEEHGQGVAELDEICGYHLEQAHRYRGELGPLDGAAEALACRAAPRLAGAGRRAMLRGDYAAAANLLRRSSDLREVVDVADDLTWALRSAGRIDDAVEWAGTAADRIELRGDPVGALRLRVMRMQFACYAGDASSAAQADLERLLELAHPVFAAAEEPAALTAEWLARTALAHGRCQWAEVTRCADIAAGHARASGNRVRQLHAELYVVVGCNYGPTPAGEVLALIDSAEAKDDPSLLLGYFRANQLAMLGRIDEARRQALETRARQMELGMQYQAAIASQARAFIELLAGDAAAAERVAREGCEALEALGEHAFLSTTACILAGAILDQGDHRLDEAERWIARARESGAEYDLATQIMWRDMLARVLSRRGEHEAAVALCNDALARADRTDSINHQADVRLDLSEVLERAGDQTAAIAATISAHDLYAVKENLVMAERAQRRHDELVTTK